MIQPEEMNPSYWDTLLASEGMPSEIERVGILPDKLQHRIDSVRAEYSKDHDEDVAHSNQVIEGIGKISLMELAAIQHYGLEVPMYEAGAAEAQGSQGDPFDSVVEFELAQQVREALRLSVLSDREAAILAMRHGVFDGEPMTLQAIGDQLGTGRENVRQIEAKAARKIRRHTPNLRSFITDSNHAGETPPSREQIVVVKEAASRLVDVFLEYCKKRKKQTGLSGLAEANYLNFYVDSYMERVMAVGNTGASPLDVLAQQFAAFQGGGFLNDDEMRIISDIKYRVAHMQREKRDN